jgi:hypothetical protein
MRWARWLLVIVIAPTVFTLALTLTSMGGGLVTGLLGIRAPMAVIAFAVVIALAAVYKSGSMVLD